MARGNRRLVRSWVWSLLGVAAVCARRLPALRNKWECRRRDLSEAAAWWRRRPLSLRPPGSPQWLFPAPPPPAFQSVTRSPTARPHSPPPRPPPTPPPRRALEAWVGPCLGLQALSPRASEFISDFLCWSTSAWQEALLIPSSAILLFEDERTLSFPF